MLLALIGVTPQFPLVAYNSTGMVTYNAATQIFDLHATPLLYKQSLPAAPRPVTGVRDFHIQIRVDNTGQLVGGVAPPDLTLMGTVDVNGDSVPDYSGTLLTGDILQFGFLDVGTTDNYDLRFKPTGGALLPQFVGKDIAVTVTSEHSSFTNSFQVNFDGGAKGNIGPMPSNGNVVTPDKSATADPFVTIVDQATGTELQRFLAYERGYRGGVRVAVGDVNNDGVDEIIAAPGRSHKPEIKVFQPNGTLLYSFLAYGTKFIGGVNVAVGDVNGDGSPDIVTSPTYGVSTINVFQNQYTPGNPVVSFVQYKKSFQAFTSKFTGGSVVRVADMNQDGKGDVLVGNGPGMRSTINVFDVFAWNSNSTAAPPLFRTFLPFAATFRGGVDFDVMKVNGDAIPDVIVGAGSTGQSRVQVLDGSRNETASIIPARLADFFAFTDQSRLAPVHVAAVDLNGDGVADRIRTAQGTDGKTKVIKSFNMSGVEQTQEALRRLDATFAGMYNFAVLRR